MTGKFPPTDKPASFSQKILKHFAFLFSQNKQENRGHFSDSNKRMQKEGGLHSTGKAQVTVGPQQSCTIL